MNLFAILLAGIAAMILGSLWYSKILFGAQWIKLVGITQKDMEAAKNQMPKTYGAMFIAALVTAFVLSQFVMMSGTTGVIAGMQVGFWAWLGFVATVMLSNVLFNKQPLALYYINASYQLVTLLVMGAILGALT